MLVSVVMPVFNAAEYLRDAIGSLLAQTYSNWELIAVDDGSTDNSWRILQSYSDPRIRIFQRENGGQCAATNTGLDYINGDYVQFFDADDLMDRDKIAVQVAALQEAGNNAIAVCKWAFFNDRIEEVNFKQEPIYFSCKQTDWLCRLWAHETMMPNHGYLIPRSIIELAGKYYDETLFLNIDFEYFTRMVIHADSVIYCPDAICYYRKGIASAKTYKPQLNKRLSALESRCKGIGYMLAKEQSERSRYACRMALTILTYSYPEILPYSRQALKKFGLGHFERFGGQKFRLLSSFFGFANAVKIKARLEV
jgi:glycosyltransferase involved in cell wall biosynthesis